METLQVYSFGCNAFGQLGISTGRHQKKNVAKPVLLESFQGRRLVKQIACGSNTTWQILENGETYAWGMLPGLGLSPTSRRIPQLEGQVLKNVSSSLNDTWTTVVYENGESAYWNSQDSHMQPLSFEEGPIKQVVSTGTHMLALLENGWVVQRDHPLPLASPKVHKVLGPEKSVIAIAAHDLYSAALSDTGELYTWGIGPLGHKGSVNPIKPKPEKVLGGLENKRVVSVACGEDHMACVTESGELYTWGSATQNQLGQGEVGGRVTEPRRVQALTGKKIVTCSCGNYFTACVSDTGVLYTFGIGSSGELGHSEFDNEPFPRVVEAFKNKTVKSVICGAQHTVCIVLAGINQNQSLLMTDMSRICETSLSGHNLGEDECFYDVQLRCSRHPEKPPIRTHSIILAARCPSWRARLYPHELRHGNTERPDEEMIEIVVENMEYTVLIEFLRYLYTDRVSSEIGDRTLVLLHAAAELHNLPRLQFICQALWEQGISSIQSANSKLELLRELFADTNGINCPSESTLALRSACVEYLSRQLCEEAQSAAASSSSSSPQTLRRSSPSEETIRSRQVNALRDILQISERCKRLEQHQYSGSHGLPLHDKESLQNSATDEIRADNNDEAEEEEADEDDNESMSRSGPVQQPRTETTKEEQPEVVDEDYNPLHSLGADLSEFVGSPRFADVTFQVDDVSIPAHKAILCARSPHFRAMLTSGMREAQSGQIVVPDISPSAFTTVLKYIYTGEANINEENVVELLIISNIYSILQLQEQCENYIESGIQLDNVTDLLQMAHQFQTHHLRSVAMNYLIGRLKGDFTKLEGFSELSQEIQDEFKRGIPYPMESLIRAKAGGFQGRPFYFTLISRDFFKKRVLRGQEKWDIIVRYEGAHEPSPSSPISTIPGEQQLSSPSKSDTQTSGEIPPGEDEETKANDEPSKIVPEDFGFRPSFVTTSRGRRGNRLRGHKARPVPAPLLPLPSSSPTSDSTAESDTASADKSSETPSPFNFFGPAKPVSSGTGASGVLTTTSTTGEPLIRAKRRGAKKPPTHAPSVTVPSSIEETYLNPSSPSLGSEATNSSQLDQPSVLLTYNSDGNYTASFVPAKLGRYSITVHLNGVPIKNSPFHLRIENQIYSRNCRAAYAGASINGIITAGKEVSLVIQSRDIQNRPITVGGAEPGFRVCVYLPPNRDIIAMTGNHSYVFNSSRQNLSDKGLADVHVKDNKDGTYTATFTLRRAGDFVVDVVRHEVSDKLRLPVFGSPFPLTCFPAPSHGPKCEADGDGLAFAVLGQQATFRIRTFDRFGNIRDVGGDTFIVRIIKRGSVKLVRNEEEEREKEEEKKREEEANKKMEEERLQGEQKRQEREQQDDEIEDAAEVRREEERHKRKKEASQRKKQQRQEWNQLEQSLESNELGCGVVIDEGNGIYMVSYSIDVPLLRRQRQLERSKAVDEHPKAETLDGSQAITEPTSTEDQSTTCESTSNENCATYADVGRVEEEEVSDELIASELDPHGYQVVVTLENGGMVRGSPFDVQLLRDNILRANDNEIPQPDISAPIASSMSVPTEAEQTAGGLHRVSGGDENDRFLIQEDAELEVEETLESEKQEPPESKPARLKALFKAKTKPTRKGSFLLPSAQTPLDPPFSPPIFIPTSPRPFAPSPADSDSAAATSPFSFLPSPAATTSVPVLPPSSPSAPGFSTEIFSTMFNAHMDLMNDPSAFSFSPATAGSSPFASSPLASAASPSSSSSPFIFASSTTTTTPTAATPPSTPLPFTFGSSSASTFGLTPSTLPSAGEIPPGEEGLDEYDAYSEKEFRGKKSKGETEE